MFLYWDDLNHCYMELNHKERKFNRKYNKINHTFNHPHQSAVYKDLMFTPDGNKVSMERFADGCTIKYANSNYNGFKKFKKEGL